MKSLMRTAIVAGIAAFGIACRLGPLDVGGPVSGFLATDSTQYTALSLGNGQAMVRIVTTLSNPYGNALSLNRCSDAESFPIYSVERVAPLYVRAAYDPNWSCTGSDASIVVQRGETRVDTLTLVSSLPVDSSGSDGLAAWRGTFRIHYAHVASNPFTILLPPGGLIDTVARDTTAHAGATP